MREEAQVTLRAHLALVYVCLENENQITPVLEAITDFLKEKLKTITRKNI